MPVVIDEVEIVQEPQAAPSRSSEGEREPAANFDPQKAIAAVERELWRSARLIAD